MYDLVYTRDKDYWRSSIVNLSESEVIRQCILQKKFTSDLSNIIKIVDSYGAISVSSIILKDGRIYDAVISNFRY